MYGGAGKAPRDKRAGSTICTTLPFANHTRPSCEYAAELKYGWVGCAPSNRSYTRVCTIALASVHHRCSSESANSTTPQSAYSHQRLSLPLTKEMIPLHGRPFSVVMR